MVATTSRDLSWSKPKSGTTMVTASGSMTDFLNKPNGSPTFDFHNFSIMSILVALIPPIMAPLLIVM